MKVFICLPGSVSRDGFWAGGFVLDQDEAVVFSDKEKATAYAVAWLHNHPEDDCVVIERQVV